MEISKREVGQSLVITLDEDRLDHVRAETFRNTVLEFAESRPGRMVLDLSNVGFMDSSGLGAIVGVRKRLGWSIPIVLAGLKSPVYKVFLLTSMTRIFTFYTSVEAALSHLEGQFEIR